MTNLLNNYLRQADPIVMGVLNVTPDSFSDGGKFTQQKSALQHVKRMIEEGASIIDIGGESTRPGARAVSVDEELARVIPIIKAIRSESDVPISIDTSKAEVMREAVAVGASMINDVRALQEEGALAVVAELGVPVCLMHMQGQPRSMQLQPQYNDVVAEVINFLQARKDACLTAGMDADTIILDPGFGFGKTVQHNLSLFKNLARFSELDCPLLVGVSRKSMLGAVLDIPVGERMPASIALAGLGVWLGAKIIRAHDVQETLQAVRICQAVKHAEG